MAFYRCGGGGIPSSLKTDMNAVLNKKFGTSADYPPADWAPTVNLMGPLPERTATGSIAHITDGADEVPIKSLKVTVAPTLSGVSEVTETQTGKNLFSYDMTIYSGYWTSTAFSGTGTAYDDYDTSTGWCFVKVPVKEGSTITISGMEARSGVYSAFIGETVTDIIQTIANYNINGTKTVPTGAKFLGVIVYRGGTPKNNPKTTYPNGQIEVGSTATTYEPYTAPTVSTVNLGRTIYGGKPDIVNGVGTESYTKVKLSDLTWTKGTASGREYYNAVISTSETTNTHDIVTNLTYSGMVTVANMADKSIAKWQQSVRIYDTDISSVSELLETYGNEYIAYPNRYTVDFTFAGQEVNTRLGYNAFWSEQGDTEVTYRADLNLYEAPSMLLETNNAETEENEEQEVNE